MSARKEWHPEKVRSGLTHPVIDADGHWIEYGPVFAEKVRKAAGDKAADGLLRHMRRIPDALSLSIAERRRRGIAMEGYWGRQSTNTRDRATAMMPRMPTLEPSCRVTNSSSSVASSGVCIGITAAGVRRTLRSRK